MVLVGNFRSLTLCSADTILPHTVSEPLETAPTPDEWVAAPALDDESLWSAYPDTDPIAPLSARQERFVDEYLVDLDGRAAALRCGMSPGWGKLQLSLPPVQRSVQRNLAQRSARTQLSQDQVVQEVALLSHSRIDHYQVSQSGDVTLAPGAPEGAMAAIQSIKRRYTTRVEPRTGATITTVDVELKLWDKPGALKMVGRHVGLFPDRVELTGKNGGPVETITEIRRVVVDPQVEAV